MSFLTDIPEVEVGLDDVLTLLGIAHNESLADQIRQLYKEADTLAVFTVKVVAALYWWTSHIASATGDAFGYAVQIQSAMAEANKYELEAWRQFLAVKHPTEIRRVYIHTTRRIQVVKREMAKQQKVNLGPIKKELAALEKWKKVTVTPELNQWKRFYAAWRKDYLPPLRTLKHWINRPTAMAEFLSLPLISVMPSALRKYAAKSSATTIETILVDLWANNPQLIYEAVLKWLVTT